MVWKNHPIFRLYLTTRNIQWDVNEKSCATCISHSTASDVHCQRPHGPYAFLNLIWFELNVSDEM